jgi:hypothetical protein
MFNLPQADPPETDVLASGELDVHQFLFRFDRLLFGPAVRLRRST